MATATKTKKTMKKAAPAEKAEIRLRIDAKTKRQADRLFKQHGMTTSDGIRQFLTHAIKDKALPYPPDALHEPNAESRKAIKESLSGKGRKVTMDDLRKIWDEA